MQGMVRERFDFSYESSAAASYLVISGDVSEKVLEYHVEMVSNNAIPHIINFDYRRMDSKICFYYDVTSKLALSHFLKRGRITRSGFLTILSDISKTLVDCKNYLLSDRCFLLDPDYMYINPSSMEVSMVYVPVAVDMDINSEFREFATNLILYSVNIDDSNDNYLQKVLYYLKAEPFNIFEFYKSINMLQIGYSISAAGGCNGSTDSVKTGEALSEKQSLKDKENEAPIKKKQGFPIPQPRDQEDVKKGVKKKAEGKSPSGLKLKPVRGILLSQLILAAALILTPVYLKLSGKDAIINYLGVVIVIIALDILALKALYGKRGVGINNSEKNGNRKNLPTLQDNKVNKVQMETAKKTSNKKIYEAGSNTIYGTALNANGSNIPFGICNGNIPGRSTPTAGRISNDTVILGPSLRKHAFLKGNNNGVFEIIEITRPDFLIGRLKEHVDYVCANNAIGKVHAQIIKRDGLYFIKDMNSRNGTYLNNVRIDPGKEYEIKNNDRITLANSEYTFVVPELPENNKESRA
ncbi:MAG TPA: FHA domain-containing protein [Clostridiaceae bacterium]|nr:FHA domain-containing protein [Clostridiaceae bacterium]